MVPPLKKRRPPPQDVFGTFPKCGDSPISKSQKMTGSQKSEDSLSLSEELDFTFLQNMSQGKESEPPDLDDFNFEAGSSQSTPSPSIFSLLASLPPANHTSESDSSFLEKSQSEASQPISTSQSDFPFNSQSNPSFEEVLVRNITSAGISSCYLISIST